MYFLEVYVILDRAYANALRIKANLSENTIQLISQIIELNRIGALYTLFFTTIDNTL